MYLLYNHLIIKTMNTDIEKNILDNNIISKRRKPIIALLLFVASIVSFAIALSMNNENGAKMPMLLIACILLVIGIIKLFIGNKIMIYALTGEQLQKRELFFEQNELDKVMNIIAKGEIATLEAKAKSSDNLPVKVKMLTTGSYSVALCRVYRFIPYTYEAVTEYMVIKK